MERVIIVGGGPAGSALGCYLSRHGIANVILDGAIHPRPHVGESLVPSTTAIFEELGFLATMEREGFVRKHGASWHPPTRGGHLAIEFAEFPQPCVHQDYTYHVDRGRFDLLLLKHAEAMGSQVCQGVRVQEVLFENGFASGVRVQLAGQTVDLGARCVVDATGRGTLLGRQLGWKKADPHFNQFAVHAWFEDVERGPRPEDIHVYFLPVERGWVWQIPISSRVTSIGVVADKRVFQESKQQYGAWFERLAGSAPDIAKAMAEARRINDFKVEADYSYCMEHFVGDGFALIGDAARFVDPIFSSGVSVALSSAKFAAERIQLGFAAGDLSAAMLRPYEERLRRGTSIWYEFITLYYRLLPMFTRFIQAEPYRHQVLQLLQGEVYDRQEVPVLAAMRQFIATVESTEGHILAGALDQGVPLDVSPPGLSDAV